MHMNQWDSYVIKFISRINNIMEVFPDTVESHVNLVDRMNKNSHIQHKNTCYYAIVFNESNKFHSNLALNQSLLIRISLIIEKYFERYAFMNNNDSVHGPTCNIVSK